MKHQIKNQNGGVSILMIVLCLIVGAIAFKVGFIDKMISNITDTPKTNKPPVEIPNKSKVAKLPDDQIRVEEILQVEGTQKDEIATQGLRKKAVKPSKKTIKKQKMQDSVNFSLAMKDVMNESDPHGFSLDDMEPKMKKKPEREVSINAGELYQAYLESWRELE